MTTLAWTLRTSSLSIGVALLVACGPGEGSDGDGGGSRLDGGGRDGGGADGSRTDGSAGDDDAAASDDGSIRGDAGPGPGDGAPWIRSFTAMPVRIAPGAETTLRWDVTGADAVSIDGIGAVSPSSSRMVAPSATTLYILRATNAVGERTATATVVVTGEAVAMPAWRDGMEPFEWRRIAGTDLSSITPEPSVCCGALDADGNPLAGFLGGRIDAWNGLAGDPIGSRLYSAANGGHADYAGNEVYELALAADVPEWVMIRAPTGPEFILPSDYTAGLYYDRYLDGRPGSTHSYYALQFLPTKDAVVRFGAGSLYGTGNEGNSEVEVFSLATNDWLPADSWPDVGPRGGSIGWAVCRDPETDDVFVGAPEGVRKLDAASETWSTIATWIENHTAVGGRACAVDPVRDRVVFFGDAYSPPLGGLWLPTDGGTLTEIAFSGPAAPSESAWIQAYAWYDATYETFFLLPGDGGALVSIDPATFAATSITTTGGGALPDAVNGVQTRFQPMPALGGYAYYAAYGDGVWFLATE
jgi:hypothetical protein